MSLRCRTCFLAWWWAHFFSDRSNTPITMVRNMFGNAVTERWPAPSGLLQVLGWDHLPSMCVGKGERYHQRSSGRVCLEFSNIPQIWTSFNASIMFFGKNMEIHSPIQLCESAQLPLHGFFQSIHLVEVSCACCLPVALSSDAAMQFSHQCTPSLQEELSLAGMQQFANDVLEIGSRSFDIHAANVIKRCTHQDVRYQLWFYII